MLLVCGCRDQWWHSIPGYGGYWWQRGQPKSVSQLLTESQGKLDAALTASAAERKEIVPAAKGIRESLSKAAELSRGGRPATEVVAQISAAEQQMIQLEGRLSVGSRAAYGELASQLREFASEAQGGQETSFAAFGLFTARTFVFLANELSMPPPIVL